MLSGMTGVDDLPAALREALSPAYQLKRVLGVGGMATVYLAHDRRHDREVAIKVLGAATSSSLGAERFHREIRVLARLRHPFILPLHDSGEAAGCLYYVMPHIDGETLRGRLARTGPLPVDEAMEIVRQVGAALDYAHGEGVVHRDVKPENILLSRHGHALLADFGIARGTPRRNTDVAALTEAGLTLGTATYMSPEQAMGDRGLDGRADLYALACVLFEMLTGTPPYVGPTGLAVVAQHLTSAVPSVGGRRPDAPPAVQQAIERALQKEPHARFEDVGAFVRALGTTSGPLLAPERRGPGGDLSIAVLPIATIGGTTEDQYFGEGLAEELINALAKLEGLRVVSRTSAFSFRDQERTAREIGEALGVSFVLEGSVRRAGQRVRLLAKLVRTGDGSLLWSESYDRQLQDVFAVQDEITASLTEVIARTLQLGHLRGQVPVLSTRSLAAYDLYLLARHHWYLRTRDGLARAVTLCEQAIAADPGYAAAHAGLADALMIQASWQFAEPAEMYPRAAAAARRALELDPALADAHASLGFCKMNWEWDWDGVVHHLGRAIALNPSHETAHRWLSAFLAGLGRYEEALPIAERVPGLDPLSILPLMNLGIVHLLGAEYVRSEQAFRQVIARDPGFARGHSFLAAALVMQQRFDEALQAARQGAELAPGNKFVASPIGLCLGLAGRPDEARAFLNELGDGIPPGMYRSWNHAVLGDAGAAIDELERGVALRSDWMYSMPTQPWLFSLHGEPRFLQLLDRLRLPRPRPRPTT
jgi:serine/threonine-protein kinase